ncbi:6084_t:CDS:10 [Entrophospora sp. SA101]|nr:6084_t:CDS:10 [Entrophospora sp. SA101]
MAKETVKTVSEEDLQLKDELELLIERLKEENVDLHRPVLESLRVHIRTSTSSMTSVPKPLKFLRPHYATITEIYLSWPESDNKHFLADILSVLAMTYDEGKRDSLKYRLEGSREEPGSWGHEYVRHLSTEIGQEFLYRQESDKPTEDLMNLALEIVPFLLKHNAEADAVDLFLELEAIDKLPQFVDKDTYPRVFFPDDVSVLKTAHQIYCQHNKFTEAVSLAIRLGNEDLIKENFEAAGNFDPLLQKQIAFQLARQHITLPVDNEELLEIINNTHLSKHFIALAEELDVMEPKTPEDIYKSHLENIRPGYTSGNVDSARQNLASTFVNAFVNAGFCTDKLVSIEDGNAWLFKNKEQGMLSAAASIGLVTLWDVDAGLVCIDKYLYSKEDYIKAGALLAIGLFNTGVRNENDPAFALLSEHIESSNLNMRICAIVGLGMAYAGSHREDIQDILLPLVSDTNLSMEIASVAALSLGLIFVGNCNGDITSTILQTMMEREDSQLKEIWGRFMGLGLALLYLGKQDAAEVTLETLKAIEHPISKQVEVLVEICSYAGTGNVLKVQNMMHICDDHLDKEKDEDLHQAFAVLGVALIAMGEDIGAEMALRMFNHLMHYGEPVIRRTVPLALGLLCASNPLLNVLETLSKYSHDNDADVAINAIFAMGLVGAGTNNARLAQMLRQLASYYHKDANCLFMVRIAQGLLHMGKGTISINSFHSDRQLLSPVAIAGVLITLIAFTDTKTLILGKYHWFLYYLATAMYPRFLITLDENLNSLPVTVRVGQAVDVVGQAGRPKTITGFQTHSTPVLLAHSERAELATEECILYYFCCEDVNFVCYNYHNIITLTQKKSLDISLSHILEEKKGYRKEVAQSRSIYDNNNDNDHAVEVGNDKQVNNELKSTTIKGYKSSWNKPIGGEDDLGGWADFGIQSRHDDYNNKDKDAVVVDSHQQNISKLFISPDSINNDCDVNDDKEILVDIGTWDKPGSVIDMIWDSSATEQSNSDNTIEVEEEEESIKKSVYSKNKNETMTVANNKKVVIDDDDEGWGTPPESAIAWNDPRQGEKVQRQHQKEESCHKEACAIQACLQKNNYQESKCQESINQLYQCCEKLLKSGGESASCSKKIMKNKDFL